MQQDLTCNMPATCREREYVFRGKLGLDMALYPCCGPEDNSGLRKYLGDLCKPSRNQWAEYILLVSSLLWPALHYFQVSTCDACGA